MNLEDQEFIQKTCLDKFQLASSIHLNDMPGIKNSIKMFAKFYMDKAVLELRSWVLTDHEDHYTTVPFYATWWDHFKYTVLPFWFVKRFPVRYKEHRIKTTYVCPHADIPWSNDASPHIYFMQGVEIPAMIDKDQWGLE